MTTEQIEELHKGREILEAEAMIEAIIEFKKEQTEKGFIPTLDSLIEEMRSEVLKMKEESIINEANRITQHND